MANLSKTLHINFYQNRLSIVEVMIKNLMVFFMPHSVVVVVVVVVVVLYCYRLYWRCTDLSVDKLKYKEVSTRRTSTVTEHWQNHSRQTAWLHFHVDLHVQRYRVTVIYTHTHTQYTHTRELLAPFSLSLLLDHCFSDVGWVTGGLPPCKKPTQQS